MASDYEDDAFEEGSFELPGMDSRPASAAASHSSFFGDEHDKQHVEQYKAGKSSPTASSASVKSPSMTSLTSGQPKPSIFSTADASRSSRVVSELDALVQRSSATKAAAVAGGDDEHGDDYDDEFPTDDDAGSVASEEGVVARNPSPEPALRVKPVEPAREVVEALTPGPRVDIDSPIVKPKLDVTPGPGAPALAPAPFVFKRAPLVSSSFEAPPVVPVASYAPKAGPSGDEPVATSVFRAPAPAPAPVRQPIPQYDDHKMQSDADEYSDEYSEPDDDKPTASSQAAPKPALPNPERVAVPVTTQPPAPASFVSNDHVREKRVSVNAHSRRSSFQHTDAGDDYADDGYEDDEFAGDEDGEDDDDDAGNTFLTSPSSKSAKPPAPKAETSPVVVQSPVVVAPPQPQPQPQFQPATVVIDAVVKVPKPGPSVVADARDDGVRTPVISAGSSVSVQSSSVTAPGAAPSPSNPLGAAQPSVVSHAAVNKPVVADHSVRPAVAPVAAKPHPVPAPESQRPSVHRSAAAASPLAPVTPPTAHKHQPKRQSPVTVAASHGRRTPKDFPVPKEVEERIRSEHARVVAATTIQLAYRAYRHRLDLKHVLSMKRRMMYFERDRGKSSLSKAYVAMAQHAASPMPAHGKVVYHKGVAYRADEYAALPAWHAPNYGTHGHGARASGDRRSHSSAAVVNPKLMQGVRLHGDRDQFNGRVATKPSLPAVARSNTKPTQLYQGRQSGGSDPRARGRELAQQHARPGAKSTPPVSRRLSDDPPVPKRPVVYDSNGRRVAHPVEAPKPAPRPIVMNRNARPAWGSVHNAPAPKYAPPPHRPRADGQRRSGPGIPHAGSGVPARGRPVVPPDVKFEQPPSKLPVLKTRVGQDPTVVAYVGKDADPDGLLREQAMRMHRSKKELDAALYALQAGVPTKL